MSELSKFELTAEVEALMPDNTSKAISPMDVRKCIEDLIDSHINIFGEGNIAGLLKYSGDPSGLGSLDDNTLINKGYVDAAVAGGAFIPLTGAGTGAPVTGFINFDVGIGIAGSGSAIYFSAGGYSIIGSGTGSMSSAGNLSISSGAALTVGGTSGVSITTGGSIGLSAFGTISHSCGGSVTFGMASDFTVSNGGLVSFASAGSFSVSSSAYTVTSTGGLGIVMAADYSGSMVALSLIHKGYVDNLITGLAWKQKVRAATTANITLSGAQTIDGVSIVAGDRVLVKNQSTASQNGIYVAASGAWTRATDSDTGSELINATVLISEGTANADQQWTCSNDSITLGSTSILFVQIAGAGTYTNGTGITLSGNIFSLDVSYFSGAISGLLTSNLTASRALASDGSGKIIVSSVTSAELGYVSGVTSAIQTQLNAITGTTLTINGTAFDLSANRTWNVGTVTSIGIATANGVSGSAAITSSGNITITLGAITPSSVAATGLISGSNLSGTNTGDQDLSGYALIGQTMYIGTTAVAINRASAALALTGITSIDGNAATVTNGVYTSGSYSDPSWISSLSWGKLSGVPTTVAGYGITDVYTKTATDARYLQLSGGTMSGDLTLVGLPTNALHAASKSYVDNALTGLSWKQEVKAATTGNITLSGAQTIDGIAIIAGDRVLVKNQTSAITNGIYLCAAGAWTRTIDADTTVEIETATVLVRLGTANADTQWTCTNSNEPVIGVDNIAFGQISGAGTYTNGSGITLTGNVFSISAAAITNSMLASSYLFTASPAYTGSLTTGALGYSDTGILASFQASANSYEQIILRNTNAGAAASSDFIVSNDSGTATTFYGDFGINSSAFTGSGSLNLANATYLTSTSGDLVLGTTTSNSIRFVINGGTSDAGIFDTSGNFGIAIAPLSKLHIAETSTSNYRGGMIDQYNVGTNGARFFLRKSRGTASSPNTTIVTGDILGSLFFSGDDGTSFVDAGGVRVTSLGTISTGVIPTKMELMTMTAAGVLTTGFTLDQSQNSTFAGSITISSGQLLAQTGTSAAPGISFSAKPDYGITQTGTSLLFSTAGASRMNISSTAFNISVATLGLVDGATITSGSSSGIKLLNNITHKFGIWNATPISQPANTVAIDDTLVNIGLRASGGVANFTSQIQAAVGGAIGTPDYSWVGDTDTGFFHNAANGIQIVTNGTAKVTFSASALTIVTTLIMQGGQDIQLATSTGTKLGTATNQLLGVWNATPISQPANTIAIDTLLGNIGLRATGGSALFDADVKINVVGNGLYIKEGTNATMGRGTLVAGTVVISTTKVTASSEIFLTDLGGGVIANIGSLYISAKTAGTSFTVSSSNALDTSTFCWLIIEPS